MLVFGSVNYGIERKPTNAQLVVHRKGSPKGGLVTIGSSVPRDLGNII